MATTAHRRCKTSGASHERNEAWPHSDRDADHHFDTQRVEAFSDGVFAIAITLLIIEIGVPHIEPGDSLTRALVDLWPSYFGYVVSFVTIGVMWINHHYMFKDIQRVDHTLLVLNLLLLLSVAFLPFPTAVLAEYLGHGEYELEATLTDGCTFVVIALCFNALWLYAATGLRLIDDHVREHRVRSRTRRYLVGPLTYGVTLPLAFVSPWISVAMYGLLALFWLLPYADEV